MDSIGLEKLKTLIEINGRINSNYSDVNALLLYILESAMRLVKCESSSLLLVNKADGSLHFALALGPKGAEAKDIPVDKKSIAGWVASNNQHVIINEVSKDARFSNVVQQKTGYITHTMIAVPMRVKGECIGVIELLNKEGNRNFDKSDLELLEILCNQASIAYQNADTYRMAQERISVLQSNLNSGNEYHTFISKSVIVQDLVHVVEEIAKTSSSVLITGESGVGKELFAEQVHLKSSRCNKPFVRVNCAALAPALLESELFGHEKGAFTDATTSVKGRFETADGGTLFLDEIGELPLSMQAKLLRVIQTKQFERVGSSKTIKVDVRIVAATNRDLEEMVKEGTFRSDLYYRLNVLPINIPPLRDRKDDIEPLALFFLKKFSDATKKNFTSFSDTAMQAMYKYYWPGNIRELENCIERACVLGNPPVVQVNDLRLSVSVPIPASTPVVEEVVSEVTPKTESTLDSFIADSVAIDDEDKTLKTAIDRFKKAYIMKILDETSWNQTAAGKILGIQRTYVSRLLNELHIRDERS